jgi:predicted exporter
MGVTHAWLKGKDVLVSDPPVLRGLEAFAHALAGDPDVGAVVGLPTFVRAMRYAAGEGDSFPEDDDELEDMAATLEGMSMAATGPLGRFVDRSMSQTQLTVISRSVDHREFERLRERIARHWQDTVRAHPAVAGLSLQTVGLGPLQAKTSQALVPTLVESFALTAVLLLATFLLVFRSGIARIMTMLPTLFAILVMFLVMRLTGTALNVATILIASTVLGTSENDQIHFFYHYLEGRRRASVAKSLVHTFLVSGKAIFFATLINAVGFLAFAFAEMRPVRQFGLLTALALGLAMLADFTALPAALWLLHGEKPDEKPDEELGEEKP